MALTTATHFEIIPIQTLRFCLLNYKLISPVRDFYISFFNRCSATWDVDVGKVTNRTLSRLEMTNRGARRERYAGLHYYLFSMRIHYFSNSTYQRSRFKSLSSPFQVISLF